MNKKVVLITGASSGFGKDVAKRLLSMSYSVYATARRLDQMVDLSQLGATIYKLDVTDTQQVNDVVRQVIEKEGRIDILFNNAGFGAYGTIENLPLENIEYQYNVNVFGVARMIQAVLPHMRQQKSGLILNTSSLVSNVSIPMVGWYSSTKFALRSITDALRMEVAPFGIRVVSIEPGAVRTDFEAVALKEFEKVSHPQDYQSLVNRFARFFTKSYKNAPNSESTVESVIEAITALHPKTRYRTTLDAKFFPVLLKFVPDRWVDALLSKMYGN